jgi:hypothetical protein
MKNNYIPLILIIVSLILIIISFITATNYNRGFLMQNLSSVLLIIAMLITIKDQRKKEKE